MSDAGTTRLSGSARHRAAMETARTAPAMHVPRLVERREIRQQVHGTGILGRLNTRLAIAITRAVGTMWAAYAFLLIALVSFPQAVQAFLQGDTLTGVQWLSQSFLQLVLLPIIIVGQNVISAAQDARAEADHETLTALHAINVRELDILEGQQRLLELLRGRDA